MAEPADKTTATGAPVTEAPPAAGGRGMVSTLVNGIGLLLIVVAGTAGGQFLYSLVAPHEPAAGAHEEGAEPAKGDRKPAKKAPEGPPLYHAFEPLVVNFDEGGQMRFLQVTVELMSRDPKTITAIEANTPMLRNNLLMLISNRDMKGLMTRDGKEELRSLALEDVRATLGKVNPDTHVEDVYFTTFVMQ